MATTFSPVQLWHACFDKVSNFSSYVSLIEDSPRLFSKNVSSSLSENDDKLLSELHFFDHDFDQEDKFVITLSKFVNLRGK